MIAVVIFYALNVGEWSDPICVVGETLRYRSDLSYLQIVGDEGGGFI